MKKLTALVALVAFIGMGSLTVSSFANEPAPTTQGDKAKDAKSSGKMTDDKKDEKKDSGGK